MHDLRRTAATLMLLAGIDISSWLKSWGIGMRP